MRVLLDEDIPVALRHVFEVEAETVTYRGWNGLVNGDLLRQAQREYDALVTMDTNLPHQQNLSRVDLAVVLLRPSSDQVRDLEALMPQVNALLPRLRPGQLAEVFPPDAA